MILITGWSGNTGNFVLQGIRKRFPNETIVGVARSTDVPAEEGVISEKADLADEKKLREIFAKYPFRVVIHIANIRYSPALVRLADTYGVPHIILVHTTGVYSKYQSYSNLYRQIERDILEGDYTSTAYTILRPTMIYGNQRDYNMHKLIRFLARVPVFPVFGDGSARMQPVHVEDLAAAIVACVDNVKVGNREYDLSGGTIVTYREVLDTITAYLNRRVRYVFIPLKLAILLVDFYSRLVKNPRITVEQVKRLQEDKHYPHQAAVVDIGFCPRSFEEGIRQEIDALRSAGLV